MVLVLNSILPCSQHRGFSQQKLVSSSSSLVGTPTSCHVLNQLQFDKCMAISVCIRICMYIRFSTFTAATVSPDELVTNAL